MSTDLLSIGLGFNRWQDAVEAAIGTNQLSVIGEVRGGQLIQYADGSGALINILAVEPFATFSGFESVSQTYGNITMLSDVLALCDVIDPFGKLMNSVTVNLAQGPLLADLPTQEWQPIGITALMVDHEIYPNADAYTAATGKGYADFTSHGAQAVVAGDATRVPDAAADIAARVLEAEYRHNQLTGQRFIHATVDGAFPFDVCLPDAPELPAHDQVIAGRAVMTGQVLNPVGGGCGCGGNCGCGGH